MIRMGIEGKSEKQLEWAINIINRMDIFRFKVKLINEYMVNNNIEDKEISEFLKKVDEDLRKIKRINVAGDLIRWYGYSGVSKDRKDGFKLYLMEFFEKDKEIIDKVVELEYKVKEEYDKFKKENNK